MHTFTPSPPAVPFESPPCSVFGHQLLQDFVVSFFVELSVMMLERLYLDPGSKEVGLSVGQTARLTMVRSIDL